MTISSLAIRDDDMRIIYIQKTDLISLTLLASNVGETCSFFCGWEEDAHPQGDVPPSHGDQNWWSRCDSLVLRITDKATKVECKETVSMTPATYRYRRRIFITSLTRGSSPFNVSFSKRFSVIMIKTLAWRWWMGCRTNRRVSTHLAITISFTSNKSLFILWIVMYFEISI